MRDISEVSIQVSSILSKRAKNRLTSGVISSWSQPSLLFNRSFTDTQSPAGRPVDQRALCWWQPEQQQLRQQPQILAESVWPSRGCGVPAAAGAMQELWDTVSEECWGQQEHKAPALPSHCSAHVEGLWLYLLKKNSTKLSTMSNYFPLFPGGQEAFQSEPNIEQSPHYIHPLPHLRERGCSPWGAGARTLPDDPEHLQAWRWSALPH